MNSLSAFALNSWSSGRSSHLRLDNDLIERTPVNEGAAPTPSSASSPSMLVLSGVQSRPV
jgi:hypothetical protein